MGLKFGISGLLFRVEGGGCRCRARSSGCSVGVSWCVHSLPQSTLAWSPFFEGVP